jgi:alkylated DNA nucleotide flippase Atl1
VNAVEREVRFHVGRGAKSERQVRKGGAKPVQDKVPRIARLMALALHFDRLIREGKVKDYAEIARLGGVTRARVTQVMNLLNLAPGLQERLLSGVVASESERNLRRVTQVASWSEQYFRSS